MLEGFDLEGSSCRVAATSPSPNMGARLTGVKIEKWELGETLEKLLAKESLRFVNLVAKIKEPWDQC